MKQPYESNEPALWINLSIIVATSFFLSFNKIKFSCLTLNSSQVAVEFNKKIISNQLKGDIEMYPCPLKLIK